MTLNNKRKKPFYIMIVQFWKIITFRLRSKCCKTIKDQILFQNWIHFLRKTSCWHFPKLMLSSWNGNIQQNWMIDSDRCQEYAHLHKWEGFLRKKSQLSLSQIFFFKILNCFVFILIKRWPQSYVIKRLAKKSFQESYMLLLWHFS